MPYRFDPMTETDARDLLTWRYEAPYTIYNTSDPGCDYLSELLDPRSPHFAVRETSSEGVASEITGYFAFGSACEVGAEPDAPAEPHLYRHDGSLTIGLGLRPDATGQGRGAAFVESGLALARERYHPALFRLYVYSWNRRAIRVYDRVGFAPIGVARIERPDGVSEFIEMTRLP
jgi:ribosomal-protein-alanine N-acetyltransferase